MFDGFIGRVLPRFLMRKKLPKNAQTSVDWWAVCATWDDENMVIPI